MKVLVVDDHALIREALNSVLKELKPDAHVFDASDCNQARRLVEEQYDLDLILLDLGLPDGDGFEMLGELRTHYPGVGVVVLSASKDYESVTRVLDLGAVGFIPKSATRAVMVSALQLVFAGGIYIPPEIRQLPRAPLRDAATKPASPSDLGVTARQLEVVTLMMQGKSNKAICRDLDVAEATVKNHITAVLKALKVTNRTEAVIAISKLGWKMPQTR